MRIASPVRYRASRPALALDVRYANPVALRGLDGRRYAHLGRRL